ncbi:MAG: hypothetical protein KC492_39300 [Myxococcales bacterium]|nr:hypothetical protein [Myxococcales bacterium]MCB9610292.1 hypothetical protein [Polyangiaceae bacterium]
MKRLGFWTLLVLASFAVDRVLASQLFETNVVASLLAPSASTAVSSALVALTFLLNRVVLYVALPSACAVALSRALLKRWLARPLREAPADHSSAPRVLAESAEP